MTIELIACDIAGTTIEEHGAVYLALEEAVAATGASVTRADVARWMGAEKKAAILALLGGQADETTVARVHADFRDRLAAAYAAHPPVPFEGVEARFAEWRAQGIKVALTTGFERAVAEPLLASVGWEHGVIDALVCGDEVAQGRPAPYLIHRAMERCGVHRADRVVAAGDTVLDLRAGTNAGATAVVGVLTGGVPAVTLGEERHTHLLARLADLDLTSL